MKLQQDYFDSAARQRYISDAMSRHMVPGLSIAALRGGAIADVSGYGRADDSGRLVTGDTVFEAASLTKTLFARLALGFVDSGLIDLDAPITPQLPGLFLSNDPRIERLTPRMALSHGTGLPNWGNRPLALRFEPGQGFGYSGEGIVLLQRLLEHKTGRGLPRLFQEHCLTPFAMARSAGLWHSGLDMAHGYDAQGPVNKIRDSVDSGGLAPEPNAAWSLYTTADDFVRYMQALAASGAGLRAETVTAMATPQNSADAHIAWGLGWGLVKAAPGVLWHWGDNTGFKSLVALDLNSGDGLVAFTNSDNGTAFTLELFDRFTDGNYYGHIGDFIATAE